MASSKSPLEAATGQSKVRRTGSRADKRDGILPDDAGVAPLLGDIVPAGSISIVEKKFYVDFDFDFVSGDVVLDPVP